jgi:hypothetical protein
MAVLGVDDFKSKLVGGGARPNLFKVTLNFPTYVEGSDAELASFLCRAGQLPGSTIPAMPIAFRGRQLQMAGDRVFEPWAITIMNDTNFTVRNSIERWMNGINEHSANTGRVNPADYQVDLTVDQLDKDEVVLKTYKFISAFPTALSPIDLAYDANDQIEEFTVEFTYQYWTSNTTT